MALNFSSFARSKIAIISLCCSSLDNPGFDGQSIFTTVATQTPRISRSAGGGSSFGSDQGVHPPNANIATKIKKLCFIYHLRSVGSGPTGTEELLSKISRSFADLRRTR